MHVMLFCVGYPLNNLFCFIVHTDSLYIITCFSNKAFPNIRYMGPWTSPELSLLICADPFLLRKWNCGQLPSSCKAECFMVSVLVFGACRRILLESIKEQKTRNSGISCFAVQLGLVSLYFMSLWNN